jgi:hypothetical protein
MKDQKFIEKINKFLDKKSFKILPLYAIPDDEEFKITVKLEITGEKEYITVGELTPYYTYTVYLLDASEFMRNLFSDFSKETKVTTYDNNSFVRTIEHNTKTILENIIDMYGLKKPVILTKIVKEF